MSAVATPRPDGTAVGDIGPDVPRLLSGLAADRAVTLADHRRVYPVPIDPRRRGPRDELIGLVERSGLRGRGGAGFPTGVKLRAVADQGKAGYVVVNGTEGEPASSKDKLLLTRVPHLVIDGALIAAAAVGAREVVVCVDRHAAAAVRAVERAVAEREGEGSIPIKVAATPPRYVAGEETALVHWLNGGPAKPTFTPPRPFEKGVGGRPTLVNNAETLAHVAQIARWGDDWFRRVGPPDQPGTLLVTLLGVPRPGVYEVPVGTRLIEVVDAAGGTPDGVSGVLVGGYFGSWLTEEQARQARLSNESLRAHGAAVGCGAVSVLPKHACGVLETARVLSWLAAETAGQCGPCVHGLAAVAGGLGQLVAPRRGVDPRRNLQRWAGQIEGRGACKFPDGAVRFLRSATATFATDFARHGDGRVCAGASGPGILPIPASSGGELEWR